ncbi:LapA family protein [Candidatus Desulfovibrio trichonymphae]|nr:LapA family protein [Candidatus Desulfovibrio trichonymphae]
MLLLVVLVFLALIFFFQNQNTLSQDLVLSLNLFFIPAMTSLPLPFYFIVIAAFFLGAILSFAVLVWDKVHLSARLMKNKWRIASLEREVGKLQKKLEDESSRNAFLHTTQANIPDDKKFSDTIKKDHQPDDVAAPDPDRG